MRATPECLRGVFTTRRYTNPRLPLPLLLLFSWLCEFVLSNSVTYAWKLVFKLTDNYVLNHTTL